MPEDSEFHSAREAARILGISLDTLRRWDASGKIVTERDASNRRIVPHAEVRRLTALRTETGTPSTGSARNRIGCTVTSIEFDGFLARVELETIEPARLVAVITRESAEELDLEVGSAATAVVKATSMMIDSRA
jgi:molybdopterin-binding protein